jgi:hypothetical protein
MGVVPRGKIPPVINLPQRFILYIWTNVDGFIDLPEEARRYCGIVWRYKVHRWSPWALGWENLSDWYWADCTVIRRQSGQDLREWHLWLISEFQASSNVLTNLHIFVGTAFIYRHISHNYTMKKCLIISYTILFFWSLSVFMVYEIE